MALGKSVALLWEVMQRQRGATIEYEGAEIVLDEQIAFLPRVRAEFLRIWPGSLNPHSRRATFGRCLKSICRGGGFTRLDRVPLRSHRIGCEQPPAIFTTHGREFLVPCEQLSPFVLLGDSPGLIGVPSKKITDGPLWKSGEALEAFVVVQAPTDTLGKPSLPVVAIEF